MTAHLKSSLGGETKHALMKLAITHTQRGGREVRAGGGLTEIMGGRGSALSSHHQTDHGFDAVPFYVARGDAASSSLTHPPLSSLSPAHSSS